METVRPLFCQVVDRGCLLRREAGPLGPQALHVVVDPCEAVKRWRMMILMQMTTSQVRSSRITTMGPLGVQLLIAATIDMY